MLILYTAQSCSTAGEVMSTALYCKHWSYSPCRNWPMVTHARWMSMQYWTVQICWVECYELQVPTAAYLWIVLAINIMSKADICMLFGYFFMISTYKTVVVIIFRLESTFQNKKTINYALYSLLHLSETSKFMHCWWIKPSLFKFKNIQTVKRNSMQVTNCLKLKVVLSLSKKR